MCVIIARNPSVEIDYTKIESACLVNPDGFGIVVLDRGKFDVFRHIDPKGNDPEQVAKLLEDAKDLPVYLHLRYRTAGLKDVDNCHPFTSFVNGEFQIQFMHNGTVSDYSNRIKDKSDTYALNEYVWKPLFNRLAKVYDGDFKEMLKDPLFLNLADDYAGSSKFLFADTEGNVEIINKSQGKQFEGWWASNDYSFNRTHRTSSYGNNSGQRASNFTPTVVGGTGKQTSQSTKATECDIPWTVEQPNKATPSVKDKSQFYPPFCALAGIEELIEATEMTRTQIREMIRDYPEVAEALIVDLLIELFRAEFDMDDDEDDEDVTT